MDPEQRLELIALLAKDRAWEAVLLIGRALLEHYYPAAVFDGSSGDSGPQYVAALRRALDRIDAAAAGIEQIGVDDEGAPVLSDH
jgi:hypothetical protein